MTTAKKTVLIASDHNGNDARLALTRKLESSGYTFVDLGPAYDPKSLDVNKVDYTDYANQLAYAIQKNQNLLGILVCGTGIGMSICANRYKGVKASLVGDVDSAKKTREHNDSNVLVMGSWNTPIPLQEEILMAWLNEPFGKGRHEKRVAILDKHTREDIVLVPGVFELIHSGHIKLFEFAKSLGKVVVALNSDKSAAGVKGRDIKINQTERKNILQRIDCIDEVVIMDEPTPANLISELHVKYVVKGGLPEHERMVRNFDNVPDDCEVKMFPIDHSYSSQSIRELFK